MQASAVLITVIVTTIGGSRREDARHGVNASLSAADRWHGQRLIHSAIVARLCAAFHRSTLLRDGGNVQPGLSTATYYTDTSTYYYSKLVYEYEVQNVGDAVPYDLMHDH